MRARLWGLIAVVCAIGACTTQPSPRMDHYLRAANVQSGGSSEAPTAMQAARPAAGAPLELALWLINDHGAPGASPALSSGAMAFVRDHLVDRIQGALPVRITRVVDLPPGSEPTSLAGDTLRAQAQGAPYVLLAVVSQAESEVPLRLPLLADPEQGGGRPAVPGFEMRTNALVEFAVLEVSSGRIVAKAEGQAWNRLNRLYVPVQSNAYPVIHRSLRVAPIYPPEEHAKDIARSLASDEAVEQAVSHLKEQWPRPGV